MTSTVFSSTFVSPIASPEHSDTETASTMSPPGRVMDTTNTYSMASASTRPAKTKSKHVENSYAQIHKKRVKEVASKHHGDKGRFHKDHSPHSKDHDNHRKDHGHHSKEHGHHSKDHGHHSKEHGHHDKRGHEEVHTHVERVKEKGEPAPGCINCKKEIQEGEAFIIDRDGYNYHKDCFKCIKCGDHIHDDQYKPTKDGAMCLSCGLPQCAHCLDLIVGDLLVCTHVDGTPYAFHTQCLSCVRCGNHITGEYKATEDGFICDNCNSPHCTTCGRKIGGGEQYYLDKDTNEPTCTNCFRDKALARQEVQKYFANTPSNYSRTDVSTTVGGGYSTPTSDNVTRIYLSPSGQPEIVNTNTPRAIYA